MSKGTQFKEPEGEEFQVGNYYQHRSGTIRHILAEIDNADDYYVPIFMAEGGDNIYAIPTVRGWFKGWHQITRDEYIEQRAQRHSAHKYPQQEERLVMAGTQASELIDEATEKANPYADFRKDLERLINRHSMENGSDTPDFILAEYLTRCLEAFDYSTRRRAVWYER